MLYNEPIFFERNRVFRVYTGGALFADFFGDKREDGFYPEEWVASCVHAINEGHTDPHEGISKVEGADIYFDELLSRYKTEILGKKDSIGVLTKILDSAVRLPAQAHPDRDFAKKHFASAFGKQESWLILGKREGAKIYYGLKDGVTIAQLEEAIEKSETDKQVMAELMESFEVNVGDVIFIPAGIAHAIGAGCLLLEVQEPTDFTIQPERWCGDYRLSDNEMYIGLDKKTALGCFKPELHYPVPLQRKTLEARPGVLVEGLIGKEQTDCFSMELITLSGGSCTLCAPAGVYVVTEGEGLLQGENYERKIQKGSYFVLPACAVGKFTVSGANIKLAQCRSGDPVR